MKTAQDYRKFHKLTAVAFGSLLAVAAVGCVGDSQPDAGGSAPAAAPAAVPNDGEPPNGSDTRPPSNGSDHRE